MGRTGFAMWDGSGGIYSQSGSADSGGEPTPPAPPENPPEPPSEEQAKEGVWEENYEDVMEPEEQEEAPAPSRKKNRHIVGITVLIIIVLFLVMWTVLSPKVLAPVGRTYLENETYANLGNFTGVRSIWAGTTTWGVSVSGFNQTEVGATAEFRVLITKVTETTGNFFFRGTAIAITNVSLYSNGTYLGGIFLKTSPGFGREATVHAIFPAVGTYTGLYITARFTVYEVMRIGYFPLESINVQRVDLEPVVVTPVPT